ncbi:MAG: Fe-S cluster assembly ATPase SufC [Alphaproteobacteria bacterium]|nr:Fe-S cluster assembly ATPase SufC [Alphaproteobacteria bacterium]
MLEIRDLHAEVDGTEILKGIDLVLPAGEVHAIMGPNGSGKSTLSYILAGREGYRVTKGEIIYKGQDIADLGPDERAQAGMFLAMQYPVEIPGVANSVFLKAAVNAQLRARGEPELDAMDFLKKSKVILEELNMEEELLTRPVNVGFSGGEKKRNEVFQLTMLKPTLAVLDETDSGLDIDALKIVAQGVNRLRDPDRSMLIITHYQRLLDHIVPDRIHVLAGGRIVATGGKELALELEEEGYGAITGEKSAA